ncbi:MAG: guanylate kinase [Nitrosospira sp.]|nr:guanylate kinase [Nitrosospira sp.]
MSVKQPSMTTMGNLFIISAPSGTGKTSLVKLLLQTDTNLRLSISYTSRPARTQELNGSDYYFVSREIFKQMLEKNEFLESAEVYGNFYGTSRKWINEAATSGRDILLEIDSQGAQQVRHIFPNAISIFVLPPSPEVLEERLRDRNQDSTEVIARRILAARHEISCVDEYDYVIINKNLDRASKDLACIVCTERLRMKKQLEYHHDLIMRFR